MLDRSQEAAICSGKALRVINIMIAIVLMGTPIFQVQACSLLSEEPELEFAVGIFSHAASESGKNSLELYLKIAYDAMQFIKAGPDSFKAELLTTIDIMSSDGLPMEFKESIDQVFIDDIKLSTSTENFRLQRFQFELPPGDYEISIRLKDQVTGHEAEKTSKREIKAYAADEIAVSDLLLLEKTWDDPEHGRQVLPRVTRYWNTDFQLLAFFEVYNVPKADSILVSYEISDTERGGLINGTEKTASAGPVTKCFVEILADKLSQGDYVLNLTISANGAQLTLSSPFDWYIEGFPEGLTDIDKAIEVLKYLSPDKEYKRLRALEGAERFQAFTQFWKERDPTPLTSANEFREEYYRRVQYANEHYDVVGKEGWQTDRGWVYVMLGPPDDIDRDPYATYPSVGKTIKAVQIWSYHKYNRSLIFYDDSGFDQFILANPSVFYEIIR